MVQRDARQALVCPQETEAENVAAVARRLVDAMGRPAGRAALWPSDVPGRRVDHEFSPKARSRPSARASLEAQRYLKGLRASRVRWSELHFACGLPDAFVCEQGVGHAGFLAGAADVEAHRLLEQCRPFKVLVEPESLVDLEHRMVMVHLILVRAPILWTTTRRASSSPSIIRTMRFGLLATWSVADRVNTGVVRSKADTERPLKTWSCTSSANTYIVYNSPSLPMRSSSPRSRAGGRWRPSARGAST